MFGQQSQQNQGLFGSTPFGQQTSSLFGQPQQQSSLFGAQPTSGLGTTTTGTGGLFGGSTAQQNTGLFGSSSQGLFGQTTATPTSPFGQQTSPFGQQQSQASLFGGTQNTTGSGLFGVTPSFGTQASSSGLFSTPTKTNAFGTTLGAGAYGTAGISFREQVDTTVGGKVQSILAMKEVADRNKTLEQLRLEDYTQQATPQQQTSPFGQQASTTAPGGGLFGTTSSSGGLFGAQQKPATTGLFGTTSQSGKGLFGSSPTAAQPSSGLFGSSPPQTGGLFGNTSTTPSSGLFGSTTAAPATGSLFGTTNTGGGGLFGNKPASNTGGLFGGTTPASGGGLFGTTTTTGGGLFGGTSNATSGGLFGSSPTPAAGGGGLFGNTTSGGGLFGNTTSPTTPPGGGLFGTQSNTGGGGLFGGSNTGTTGGGLFGSKPATGGGLFGGQASGGGLFGTSQPQATAPQSTPGGGLFGSSTTAAQPSTGGGLFGAKPAGTGGGLFGSGTTGGLFSNTGTGGGLFGTSTSPTTGTGGLFGTLGGGAPATSTGGGLFGSQPAKPAGGLFGTPGGGLFGSTSPAPGASTLQQQSPTPFVNPNAPLLNATITDTYHLSRLAIGNAAKLIWGNTYTVPSAARSRPSLLGDTDFTSSTWKPVPRVSYIDTVSASARTPRVSAAGRRDTSITRLERDSSVSRKDVFDSTRDGGGRDSLSKYSSHPDDRQSLVVSAGEGVSSGQVQRASEPVPLRHPSRSYLDTTVEGPSTSVRHFEPLPLETIQARDESPENITPWMPASGEVAGRRHSQGTTPCLTPRRTGRDGFVSARRSPNSSRVPNDLAPKCCNPEIECRPTISALRRFTEADLCQVADFEVIHASYGTVMWPGYTDVRGLDIDTTIDIQPLAVEVYGEKWFQQQRELQGPDADIQEPPEGEGLNKEAIITLYNCRPGFETDTTPEETYARHKEVLRDYTKKMDAEFISLSQDWTWKFKVSHFSRYAMPMSTRSAVAPVRRGNIRTVSSTSARAVRKVEKVREDSSKNKISSRPALRLHFPHKADAELTKLAHPVLAISGSSSIGLDDKAQQAWARILQRPLTAVAKQDVQLALLQSLEALELSCAHPEMKSLFALALSVLSTAHQKGLFHSIGKWLRHSNKRYLASLYGSRANEAEVQKLRQTKHERLESALLYVLARQTTQASEILMPAAGGDGYPRLALLIESVGLHMVPNPDVLQQLESFHKLSLFELLDPAVSRLLHLLAGNVEREVLATLPTWQFALTAILWFELSANLIMEEDPLESYATHTTTLGLALDKLDRELTKQKRGGPRPEASFFSKPSEILFLRSLVDLKSGLSALVDEIARAGHSDMFLPIILSLVFHFAGESLEEGASVADLVSGFATSLRGQEDSKLLGRLYRCLQELCSRHFDKRAVSPELFLWKIVSGMLCNTGVSTILRSLEDLIGVQFGHLPLEIMTAKRALASKYETEVEALRYLEQTLGCPRVFVVVSLARIESKQGRHVKAASYWLAASELAKSNKEQTLAGTWWQRLTEMGEDAINECVPCFERCVAESLSCLIDSNEIPSRLKRLAALMTPPKNRQPLPSKQGGQPHTEKFITIWRFRSESLDGLTLRFLEELLPYDILQCLESIQATVDLLRSKFLLGPDGSTDTKTLNALPFKSHNASKSHVSLIALWNQCQGPTILYICRWLVASIRMVLSHSTIGNPVLGTSESFSLSKFLPEEVRETQARMRAPETLVSIVRSPGTDEVDTFLEWKEMSSKLLKELKRAEGQGRLFSDFFRLVVRSTTATEE